MICVKITKNNVSKVVPLIDHQVKVNGEAHVFIESCKMLIGNTLYPVERPIDKYLNNLYYAYQNKLYYYNTSSFEMVLVAIGASGTWSYIGDMVYLCGSVAYYVVGTSATVVTGLPSGASHVTKNYFRSGNSLYCVSRTEATVVSGLIYSDSVTHYGSYFQNGNTIYYVVGSSATVVTGFPTPSSSVTHCSGSYFYFGNILYYLSGSTATVVSGLPDSVPHLTGSYFRSGNSLYYVSGTTATVIATDTSGSWYNVSGSGIYFGCGLNLYKVSDSTVTLLGSGNSGTWSIVRQFLLACGPDLYYTGYGAAANSLVPIENLPSGWGYLGDYFFAVGTSVYRVGLSSNGTGYAWSVSGLPSGWMYLKDNYFYKGSDLYYVTSTGTFYKAYKVTGLPSGWEYITDKRFHCGTSLYGISGDTSSGYNATLLTVTKADTWEHIYGNIYACGTELYDLNASQYGTSDADIARLPFYFYNS